MTAPLFTLEGPLCAIEDGRARSFQACTRCGRGIRTQVSDLSVALVCPPRKVWLTDANAILLIEQAAHRLPKGLGVRPVHCRWREHLTWANNLPLPRVVQVVAPTTIRAADASVEREECPCRSVRSINFKRLLVERPSDAPGAWALAENPEVIILDAVTKAVLAELDQDLEFADVWYSDAPPSSSSDAVEF